METVFWLVDISVYVGGKYKGFLGNWFLMKKMKEFFRGGGRGFSNFASGKNEEEQRIIL